MTMEIRGKEPTTWRGTRFRRNIFGWGELARYSIIVAPDICAPIRCWLDDSLHEGLDAAGAVALADALQTEIDAGRTAAYAVRVHPEDPTQYGWRHRFKAKAPTNLRALKALDELFGFPPPPGSPHPFVENVAAFVDFLRESGGFEIW